MFDLFITAPLGTEDLLETELHSLGATQIAQRRSGCACRGTLEVAYKIVMWSRIANRVFLTLQQNNATTFDELYDVAKKVDWAAHMQVQQTFAVSSTVVRSDLNHTHFASLKVKDAVADFWRDLAGERPNVDTVKPDLSLHLHLHEQVATFFVELSAESLHRRGYRYSDSPAPLKENLAAALLMRAGWPKIAAAGGTFWDPMCGSGTLVMEAAMMAADVAPGIFHQTYGSPGWAGHQKAQWKAVVADAQARQKAGRKTLPKIGGSDQSSRQIMHAQQDAGRVSLADKIEFVVADVQGVQRPQGEPGLVVTNPPYGERLGDVKALRLLYANLGETLKRVFYGYRAAVFSGEPDLLQCIDLRAHKKHVLYNGALRCSLNHYEVRTKSQHDTQTSETVETKTSDLNDAVQMFVNRVHKNQKKLDAWVQKEQISCYRLYDADLPEYAVAIDLYRGATEGNRRAQGKTYAVVQEYAPPKTVAPAKAARRLADVMGVLPTTLNIPAHHIFLKVRERKRSGSQYESLANEGRYFCVEENRCKFWVNFKDYLDTGLFLDHRLTRARIAELSKGKRVLNLFAYTGTASVMAAHAGATQVTTVDMSNTYLDWAEHNFELNGISVNKHEFVRADCLEWLRTNQQRFDIIFLDPPTFSRSKRMEQTFDVQRDHAIVITQCMNMLNPSGTLLFSTNFQRFKLAMELTEHYAVINTSERTLPKDFAGNPRIHQTFELRLRNDVSPNR